MLYIGDNSKDIYDLNNITLFYNVTHVTHCGDGWYEIYNGIVILGFVTDVESVQEKW